MFFSTVRWYDWYIPFFHILFIGHCYLNAFNFFFFTLSHSGRNINSCLFFKKPQRSERKYNRCFVDRMCYSVLFIRFLPLACGKNYNLDALFSDIRIPLMWKDTDHFKNKGGERLLLLLF